MTTTTTDGPTIELTGLRRRRHLKRLLEVRDRLAQLATERHSHDLDDAADTFALMVSVEDEIADLFPNVHSALFPRWVSTADAISHAPGQTNRRCGICTSTRPTAPQLPDAA